MEFHQEYPETKTLFLSQMKSLSLIHFTDKLWLKFIANWAADFGLFTDIPLCRRSEKFFRASAFRPSRIACLSKSSQKIQTMKEKAN